MFNIQISLIGQPILNVIYYIQPYLDKAHLSSTNTLVVEYGLNS